MTKQIGDVVGKLGKLEYQDDRRRMARGGVTKRMRPGDASMAVDDPTDLLPGSSTAALGSSSSAQQPKLASPKGRAEASADLALQPPKQSQLDQVTQQVRKACCESAHGIFTELVKFQLFSAGK